MGELKFYKCTCPAMVRIEEVWGSMVRTENNLGALKKVPPNYTVILYLCKEELIPHIWYTR